MYVNCAHAAHSYGLTSQPDNPHTTGFTCCIVSHGLCLLLECSSYVSVEGRSDIAFSAQSFPLHNTCLFVLPVLHVLRRREDPQRHSGARAMRLHLCVLIHTDLPDVIRVMTSGRSSIARTCASSFVSFGPYGCADAALHAQDARGCLEGDTRAYQPCGG